ncbi:hypothetical protein [Embleya sp. NPDC005971]|uniref:hypothetical protein n=1 Tax=unclassified Embleya TaxID=2699296 RepID=UPI0033F5C091
MDHQDFAATAEPAALARYIADLPVPETMHGSMDSVREEEFEGHRIVIRTSYEITVDDRPVTAHLMVSNNGEVHCHALPAYQFLSAVDTVKALIQYFPDEFPPGGGGHGGPAEPGGHAGHEGHGGHEGHEGHDHGPDHPGGG